MIHYNGTEQWPTYLMWGLLLTTIINVMIWNETLLINTDLNDDDNDDQFNEKQITKQLMYIIISIKKYDRHSNSY